MINNRFLSQCYYLQFIQITKILNHPITKKLITKSLSKSILLPNMSEEAGIPFEHYLDCERHAGPGPRGDECPICVETVGPTSPTILHTTDICQNTVHATCLALWVSTTYRRFEDTTCPMCRLIIVSAPERPDPYPRLDPDNLPIWVRLGLYRELPFGFQTFRIDPNNLWPDAWAFPQVCGEEILRGLLEVPLAQDQRPETVLEYSGPELIRQDLSSADAFGWVYENNHDIPFPDGPMEDINYWVYRLREVSIDRHHRPGNWFAIHTRPSSGSEWGFKFTFVLLEHVDLVERLAHEQRTRLGFESRITYLLQSRADGETVRYNWEMERQGRRGLEGNIDRWIELYHLTR